MKMTTGLNSSIGASLLNLPFFHIFNTANSLASSYYEALTLQVTS